MNAATGLGKDNDPILRARLARQEAATTYVPSRRQSDDDDTEIEETYVEKASSSDLAPPSKEPTGRVQMSARIKVDRMKKLKKYQFRHGATFQAVVDQMVDEYLERRGLI